MDEKVVERAERAFEAMEAAAKAVTAALAGTNPASNEQLVEAGVLREEVRIRDEKIRVLEAVIKSRDADWQKVLDNRNAQIIGLREDDNKNHALFDALQERIEELEGMQARDADLFLEQIRSLEAAIIDRDARAKRDGDNLHSMSIMVSDRDATIGDLKRVLDRLSQDRIAFGEEMSKLKASKAIQDIHIKNLADALAARDARIRELVGEGNARRLKAKAWVKRRLADKPKPPKSKAAKRTGRARGRNTSGR